MKKKCKCLEGVGNCYNVLSFLFFYMHGNSIIHIAVPCKHGNKSSNFLFIARNAFSLSLQLIGKNLLFNSYQQNITHFMGVLCTLLGAQCTGKLSGRHRNYCYKKCIQLEHSPSHYI